MSLEQGSPTFFVRGPHELIQNMSRAGHLTWYDCFGICYILPNQQFFVIIFFHHCKNVFTGRMKWFRGP